MGGEDTGVGIGDASEHEGWKPMRVEGQGFKDRISKKVRVRVCVLWRLRNASCANSTGIMKLGVLIEHRGSLLILLHICKTNPTGD